MRTLEELASAGCFSCRRRFELVVLTPRRSRPGAPPSIGIVLGEEPILDGQAPVDLLRAIPATGRYAKTPTVDGGPYYEDPVAVLICPECAPKIAIDAEGRIAGGGQVCGTASPKKATGG